MFDQATTELVAGVGTGVISIISAIFTYKYRQVKQEAKNTQDELGNKVVQFKDFFDSIESSYGMLVQTIEDDKITPEEIQNIEGQFKETIEKGREIFAV